MSVKTKERVATQVAAKSKPVSESTGFGNLMLIGASFAALALLSSSKIALTPSISFEEQLRAELKEIKNKLDIDDSFTLSNLPLGNRIANIHFYSIENIELNFSWGLYSNNKCDFYGSLPLCASGPYTLSKEEQFNCFLSSDQFQQTWDNFLDWYPDLEKHKTELQRYIVGHLLLQYWESVN